MSDLDELLARVAEGDEEALAELKKLYADKDKAVTNAGLLRDRDKKVASDKTFREKFPRAMAAYDKGRLTLPDDPSDEALLVALKAKEDELIDIGFEVPAVPTPTEGGNVPDESGAAAWAGSGGPHSPADLHPETAIHDIDKAMTEPIGPREWAEKLYRANKEDPGRIGEIRQQYEAEAHPDSVVANR